MLGALVSPELVFLVQEDYSKFCSKHLRSQLHLSLLPFMKFGIEM